MSVGDLSQHTNI